MTHSPLISTIVIGLVLAFALGTVAHRFRISPLVGFLLAGVAVGPYTPGFVADQELAHDLAEIGVILLMFGVGLEFSPKELFAVRAIALPGALVQITFATAVGMALAWAMGWTAGTGLVFGLALSVASTVVVIRMLDERRLLNSDAGRISVGWLIVEDLVMVIALVLLPTAAQFLLDGTAAAPSIADILADSGIVLGKAVVFVVVMLVVGQRVIPWVLHHIAHTGSRELFRLGVLSLALGVAFGAAELVGVSFALGAFFAGLVLSESELSQRAAAESLPLRDAFAVLFFVSVGMLFDPSIFLREPWPVLGTVLVVVLAKPAAAFVTMYAFRHPLEVSLGVAASRAQIGEFSFILAGLGVGLGLLDDVARDLILAGAIISIVLTPAFFLVAERIAERAAQRTTSAATDEPAPAEPVAAPEPLEAETAGHTIVIGCGRVGSVLCDALERAGRPFVVVEERRENVEKLRERGIEVVHGQAPSLEVFEMANIAAARQLYVAVPDGFEAGQIALQARAINPDIHIVARAHSDAEAAHLTKYGADIAIVGERELADAMLTQAKAGEKRPSPKT